MKITAIIHGSPVDVDTHPGEHFYALRWRVLKLSDSIGGRNPDPTTWEIRDSQGAWVDPNTCVGTTPPGTIYITLPIGHGA